MFKYAFSLVVCGHVVDGTREYHTKEEAQAALDAVLAQFDTSKVYFISGFVRMA